MPTSRLLEIRPMSPGEERVWLACAPPPEGADAALAGFVAQVQAAGEDPECRLLAFESGRGVGRLRLIVPHPGLCLFLSLAVPEASEYDRIGAALIAAAGERHATRRVEAVCWDSPKDARFVELLTSAGFEVWQEKVYARRDLAGYEYAGNDPFTYRSYAEEGEGAFVTVLAGLGETPPGHDPEEWARTEFSDLVASAGSAFDPSAWRLARCEGEPVGVVLPQFFPHDPEEGTLYYIAVLPRWRGRGWGRILHARGLHELAARGALRYIGSTEITNAPMRRIFAANGCEEMGVRRGYRRAGSPPAA